MDVERLETLGKHVDGIYKETPRFLYSLCTYPFDFHDDHSPNNTVKHWASCLSSWPMPLGPSIIYFVPRDCSRDAFVFFEGLARKISQNSGFAAVFSPYNFQFNLISTLCDVAEACEEVDSFV